ncbi:PDZ domain-containing protein [Macrococcus brunensis]|uniref:Serine protease HtrA-like n=1 Tax=Macrococcus brunensis TaxID=198483 RepID=A0A4R6BAP8_9STAP|nr:trypsin-like peptidase domain-containing protein [Macrococcus brunensis]TDL93378.1 PDZ domain-containing protein [Macrococcus brunensis]
MGKIKILKKEYFRPKRRFRHHKETLNQEDVAEETHEESVPDDNSELVDKVTITTDSVQHEENSDQESSDEAAASYQEKTPIEEPVVVQEPIVEETAVSQVPVIEHQEDQVTPEPKSQPVRQRESPHFSWLYLIPAVLFGIALVMLWNLFTDTPEHEKPKPVQETLTKTEKAIKLTRDHVVSVVNLQKANNLLNESEVPEEVGIGSGVIYKVIAKEAFIVTNYHVIKDAQSVQVTLSNNKKVKASIIGSDEWTDLAVIKVPKGQLTGQMKFADSDKIIVGQTAIAIGSPLSQTFAGSVSQGIISGLNRAVPVDLDGDGLYDWESNVIQTDAAVNPGNSGGALVNDQGELVGINAMKISLDNVEGISFAIPSNDVKKITAILETKHKIVRPELGIQAQDINNLQLDAVRQQLNIPADMTQGVIVMGVEGGSAAEAAGLQTQDIITSMDGKKLESLVQFRKILYYDHQKGDTLTMTVTRQGKTKQLKAILK